MGTSLALVLLPIAIGFNGFNVNNSNDDIRVQQVFDVDENSNNQAVELGSYHHYYVEEVLTMVIAVSIAAIAVSSIGIGIYDIIKRKR